MRHSRRMGRPGAAIALAVLALGLVGVALAAATDRVTVAKVTVTFTDTKLVVSHGSLQAGPATFVVVNHGQKLHTLTISGPGLQGARTRAVAAGRSATLTVALRKGAYMLSDRARAGSSVVSWLMVSAVAKANGSSREVVPFPPPAPMDCD